MSGDSGQNLDPSPTLLLLAGHCPLEVLWEELESAWNSTALKWVFNFLVTRVLSKLMRDGKGALLERQMRSRPENWGPNNLLWWVLSSRGKQWEEGRKVSQALKLPTTFKPHSFQLNLRSDSLHRTPFYLIHLVKIYCTFITWKMSSSVPIFKEPVFIVGQTKNKSLPRHGRCSMSVR